MPPAATVDRHDPAHAGQAVYSRGFLTVYGGVGYRFNSLNSNSLAAASARLARYAPHTFRAKALEDWRLEPGTYGSVAMTHLLHRLPGPMAVKGVAFEHAHRALAPRGALFGATILAKDVPTNPLARAATALAAVFPRRKVHHLRRHSPLHRPPPPGRGKAPPV